MHPLLKRANKLEEQLEMANYHSQLYCVFNEQEEQSLIEKAQSDDSNCDYILMRLYVHADKLVNI